MTAARGAGLNIGGNTYVYAPQVSGSFSSDIRQILRDGYEDFVSYIERYEKEKGRLDYAPV
jgi:predicted transcriptional regulator